MLLPSALIRSELRLDTPAKRFAWAAEQLYGALYPSPAVVADAIQGVPAKVANAGIAPATAANMFFEMLPRTRLEHFQNFFTTHFYLPFDIAQHYRGVPLLYCVNPVVTAPYHPTATVIGVGAPILDNSPCKTFEQYLVEQLSYMIVANPTYNANESRIQVRTQDWNISEYQQRMSPIVEVAAWLSRTNFPGANRYDNITGIVLA